MDSTNPRRGAPLPESRFSVVLVEPLYPDNVGHVARSMLNFGLGDLVLVRAKAVDDTMRDRAVHAQGVLEAARRFDSLREVAREFDHLVGFAARISTLNKAHLRQSESLPQVARRLDELGGRVALVFGREDFGLSNEDVAACDILCTIPTSPHYRSMNLSHAVSVALYEFTRGAQRGISYAMASREEKDLLFAAWWELTDHVGFQPHRRRQVLQMFRRVIGRAGLTTWEYHRFMGVFSRLLKPAGRWPLRPQDVPDTSAADEGDDDEPDEA